MRILFIHKNFPAQFGAFGDWLSKQGWDVTFATEREGVKTQSMRVVRFKPHRSPNKKTHRYLVGTEAAIIAAQSMARTAIEMSIKGYKPDIVVAHSGWGGGSFVKDVWPDCKFVPYLEWYYNWPARDATPHEKNDADPIDLSAKARVRNLPFHLDLAASDSALCPTQYQADQFPDYLKSKIKILHDGVDTKLHAPAQRSPELCKELGIPIDAEIVTWVTRGMEPMRGFPEMMKAISELQKSRLKLHTIIVGEDRIAYGAKAKVKSWKEKMLAEHNFDLSRTHFTGLVSRNRMINIMNAGDLHLHLTAPFVLSWSLLDAMSVGCTIVTSDVAPVREFIEHGKHGLTVPPYQHEKLIACLNSVLDNPSSFSRLGQAARDKIVHEFDANSIVYPAKKAFLESLLS